MSSLIQKPINLGLRIIYSFEKWLYLKGALKTDHLTLPDFMCIGVEKAGTTWLHKNLQCHPQLFLPDRKELNFFSNKYRFYGMPLSGYGQYFKGSNLFNGEVTPCANLHLKRIHFIKQIMPDIKVILILRNPADRMWAAVLMHLVRAQKKKFDTIQDSEFHKLFRHPDFFSRGDYPQLLSNWRSVFTPEQLHICLYDDLKSDPENFLTGIFRFLGVDPAPNWQKFHINEQYNKSPEHEIPSHLKVYLKEMYRESIEKLKIKLPQAENWLSV